MHGQHAEFCRLQSLRTPPLKEKNRNHLVWQLVHLKAQDLAPKDMEN